MEFTSTDIVDPVWNSGERSPWLTIFERERKYSEAPGKASLDVSMLIILWRGLEV